MSVNVFRENVRLAWGLARRDLKAKYRRSVLAWGWLVLTPLCLLGIYSLVFGEIFGVKWHLPHDAGTVGFALPFFVGLSVYLVLSDVVNSSSSLFAGKRDYVSKSSFPLWVLWMANLMRAAVHAGVILLLVLALALYQHRLTWVGFGGMMAGWAGCSFFVAALSLLLAALGPFAGDISEGTRLLLRVLFYATPITYPIEMVPEPYRSWMWGNPLTVMVEMLREPIVFGHMLSLDIMGGFILFSVALFALALWIFQRLKKVIPDVV